MKKSVLAALVLGMVAFGTVANAAEKIAMVSLQQALNTVNDGKKAKTNLKKEYDVKKKEIDKMKVELEDLGKKLESQKMVLSPEALNEKRKELQTKFMDLQNKAATFERELKTKEAESAKAILLALRDIVLEISKSEGYTLVIENSSDTVLFSANGEDITAKVIAAYNSKK